MPYIITDGTSYCHRTKTQAVEITPDKDLATRFRNAQSAQKLLARATKKLKGFELVEIPSRNGANAPSGDVKSQEIQEPKDTAPQTAPAKAGEEQAAGKAEAKPAVIKEPVAKQTEVKTPAVKEPVARQNEVKESEAKQNEAKEPEAKQSEAKESEAKQNEAKESEAKQNEAKESEAKQNEAKESEAKQNEAKKPEMKKAGTENREGASGRHRRRPHRNNRRGSDEQTKAAASERPETPDTSAPQIINEKPSTVSSPVSAEAEKPGTTVSRSVELNTAHLWGEPVNIASRAQEKPLGQEETASSAVQTAPETVNAPKPAHRYPTSFTRRKPADSEWSIEDATSRVFGKETAARPEKSSHDPFADHTRALTPNEDPSVAVPVDVEETEEQLRERKALAEKASHLVHQVIRSASALRPLSGEASSDGSDVPSAHEITSLFENTARTEEAEDRPRGRSKRRPRRSRFEAAPGAAAAFSEESAGESSPENAPEEVSERPAPDRQSQSRRRRSRFDQEEGANERRTGRNDRSSRSRASQDSKDISSAASRRRLFTQQERNLIYNRSEGHCGICGRFIPLEEYTIDHIIPLSKGGTNDLDNLQACCSFCNKAKDDSMGEDFFNRIERIYLYQAELKYRRKQFKKLKKVIKELDEEA